MNIKKTLGQYMTPNAIAEEMCRRFRRPVSEWIVLDPACGDGNLLIAAVEFMKTAGETDIASRIIGIDVDVTMADKARGRLAKALCCDEKYVRVYHGDFLNGVFENDGMLCPVQLLNYNLIFSNPPYGKLREYKFFDIANSLSPSGTELVFLMPLSFLDRAVNIISTPLSGKPMKVTTGHTIAYHVCGSTYKFRPVRCHQSNASRFVVQTGVKIYEEGAGSPPQTKSIISARVYSSVNYKEGWLPCLRTGDISPYKISTGRLWVDYGEHLAHPKNIGRFTGPKIFIRRIPLWGTRHLAAAYTEDTILCAGDVLVIKHAYDNSDLLKGLCVYLNSKESADIILNNRPSVFHRDSFPKISAKDLNILLDKYLPNEADLLHRADKYNILALEWKDIANDKTHRG